LVFEIELERQRSAALSTVTAYGDIDGQSADHVSEILRMASSAPRVVIDLARVRRMEGDGLAALVSGIERLRESGGDVQVVATAALSEVLADSGVGLTA